MPIRTVYTVHDEGRTLWPEKRPLRAVLEMKSDMPTSVWWSEQQGLPTAPGGSTFLESWWDSEMRPYPSPGAARYNHQDPALANRVLARYISVDASGGGLQDASSWTAAVVGELMPDYYRLVIRDVWRARLTFPEQEEHITSLAHRWNYDDKLMGIVIENASNGAALLQNMSMKADRWIRKRLKSYTPSVSKEMRADNASPWCRSGMVLLPWPGDTVRWLFDFEYELFNFPGGEAEDQVDAFSQLVLYLEHYLSRGWRKARGEYPELVGGED